jgi:hypothetical protein
VKAKQNFGEGSDQLALALLEQARGIPGRRIGRVLGMAVQDDVTLMPDRLRRRKDWHRTEQAELVGNGLALKFVRESSAGQKENSSRAAAMENERRTCATSRPTALHV